MIDERRLLETFLHLVRIDSPSGQEEVVAGELAARLRQLGLTVERDAMHNIVATLPGHGDPLLLAAHMDTVMPGHGIKPLVKDGVVFSDGSTILGGDDKSGVAVILEVLQTIIERELPHPPLEVVITVQEEVGLVGARALDMSRLQARMGVSFDTGSSPGTIVIAAPSHNHIAAVVQGKAAHAGTKPEQGINAILVAAEALVDMPLGRIDGETTANIGRIEGGRARNIIPDRVELLGEARSHQLHKLEAQTARMIEALEAAAARHGATVQVQVTRVYDGYRLSEADGIVDRLIHASRSMGFEPNPVPSGGGSDANIFIAQGIQVANLSTGMAGEHSTGEHIAVADMVACAQIVLRLFADLTGVSE
jgi:tripeptide aminopeptidase